MENEEGNKLFKTESIIYLIFIAIFVYVVIIFYSDYDNIKSVFAMVNPSLLVILLSLTLLNYLFRYLKWRMGTHHLENVTIMNDIIIYFSGFLFSLTPSKAGEAARGVLMNKRYPEINVSYGISLTVVDRLSDLIGISFLSILMLFFMNSTDFLIISFLFFFGILSFTIVLLNHSVLNCFANLTGKFSPKIKNFLVSINSDLSNYGSIKFIFAIFLSTLSWSFEGIGLYIVFNTFRLSISLPIAIFVFSLSTIVGAISFLPGGLGGAEASMIGLIIFFGKTSSAIASGSTLIIRIATLWFGIVFGLINYIIFLWQSE